MKKYLLVLICFLATFSVKAQTYTGTHGHLSVTLADTMTHDSITCSGWYYVNYNIAIDSSFIGDSVNIVDTSFGILMRTYYNATGASPWIFTATVWNEGFSDIITPIGGGYAHFTGIPTKVTCLIDTLWDITPMDSFLISNPCLWSIVHGRAYIDNDSNCIFSTGDYGLEGLDIKFVEYVTSSVDSLSGAGYGTYTGGYYDYNVQVSWMWNYVVSLPSYYSFIFHTSPCFTSMTYNFTTAPIDTADFPVRCTHMIDVECGIMPPGRIRLHRDFYLDPFVNNTGCDAASGTMTLVLDSRVNYNSTLSVHPADTVRGDTLIWNYSGLSNLSSGSYWNSFISNVYLSLDSTVVVGDTLCFRVYTNVPAADINATNNDYSICVPVVYSYDPNSKEVSPAGNISSHGDTLTYTINFQNTGSAEAQNIRIVDTLDSRFNMSSLKVLSASHAMMPKWLASNVVEFDFDNINLPDSTSNEPGSHGVVQFSIALNPGTTIGTQIKNKGYIYFDLNPPVLTNTTVNTVTMLTLATKPPVIIPVKIYPNPATDKITVENLNGGQISILNMNGSIVYSQEVSNQKTEINVSNLPDGIYIIKTVSKDATSTIKFTKQ